MRAAFTSPYVPFLSPRPGLLQHQHQHHRARRKPRACHPSPHPHARASGPPPASRTPPPPLTTASTFADLSPSLPPALLSRVLALYTHPTHTQRLALPPLLRGEDVLLHAPTGTGKTLCYLLTCLSRIDPSRASAQAVILVPTAELCAQVIHVLQKLSDLPFAVLHTTNSDVAARAQRMALRTGPRIVLGTPEGVYAMRGVLRLDLVRVLVADEFDACLACAASTRALESVLSVRTKEERQTVLASATVPQQRHFLRRARREGWLRAGVKHVRGVGELVIPEGIRHAYVPCPRERKLQTACGVVASFRGKVIVFVSERRDVDEAVRVLGDSVDGGVLGIRAEWSAGERRHAMKQFREGVVRTLVATDVAARGIDIPDVVGVVQLDLPRDAEGYLHRAGRAGRMGRRGWSVLVVGTGEGFVVDRFANFLGLEFRELGRK